MRRVCESSVWPLRRLAPDLCLQKNPGSLALAALAVLLKCRLADPPDGAYRDLLAAVITKRCVGREIYDQVVTVVFQGWIF